MSQQAQQLVSVEPRTIPSPVAVLVLINRLDDPRLQRLKLILNGGDLGNRDELCWPGGRRYRRTVRWLHDHLEIWIGVLIADILQCERIDVSFVRNQVQI